MMTKKTLSAILCALGLSFSVQANDLVQANDSAQANNLVQISEFERLRIQAENLNIVETEDSFIKQIAGYADLYLHLAIYPEGPLPYLRGILHSASGYVNAHLEIMCLVNEIVINQPDGYLDRIINDDQTLLQEFSSKAGPDILEAVKDSIEKGLRIVSGRSNEADLEALLYFTAKPLAQAMINSRQYGMMAYSFCAYLRCIHDFCASEIKVNKR